MNWYHRSTIESSSGATTAGNEQPLPSDVRSPEALICTMDYFMDEVLSNNPIEKCHGFNRDRTRAIRQDFTR
ncbi:hypothetical protein K501DRAFT_198858 [Backusella circina FSU 941]|nr:hypothetical protein K501DRAFT_198858 [Backusella circina FSU 941]